MDIKLVGGVLCFELWKCNHDYRLFVLIKHAFQYMSDVFFQQIRKFTCLIFVLVLVSCGGGGGDGGGSKTGVVDITKPSLQKAAITLAISTNPDEITLAWLPATDDITPGGNMVYEVHAGKNESYIPDNTTLVGTFTGDNQGDIVNRKNNTTYYMKVIAVDEANNKSIFSDSVQVTTAINSPVINHSVYKAANTISSSPPAVTGTDYTFQITQNSVSPSVDEVIVGADTNGDYYLRTVDGVSTSGSEIIVQTSDASLADIVDSAVISSTIVLVEPQAIVKNTTNKVAYKARISKGKKIKENVWSNELLKITQIDEATRTSINSNNVLKKLLYSSQKLAAKTPYTTQTDGGELVLTSSIDFEPQIVTYAEKTFFGGIKKAEVYAKGVFDLNATLAYNFSASGSVAQTKRIFSRTYSSVYQLGPVPVQQDITLTIDASFTGDAKTEIAAETIAKLMADVQFGARYENGQWSLIDDKKITKSLTISATVEGEVTAEVRIIPNIEVKFYKVAAAGLSVEPFINGTAAAEIVSNADLLNFANFNNYRFTQLDAALGVDANVYAELKVFSKVLARYPEQGKQNIFNLEYPLFSLPSLGLSGSGVPYLNDSSYTLTASAQNGVNNAFDSNSINWVVYPSGQITQNSSNPFVASFTPDNDNTEYFIYFIGNGESIGSIGRQFESITVSFLDDDNDGIPTAWENAYGLNPQSATDAASDPDNDGYTNLQEYNNNTNPNVFDDAAINNVIISITANASVTEGDSGSSNMTFAVTLSDVALGNVEIDYLTSNGTATAGSDYTATSGTLTILSGSSSASISVPITGDTAVEGNETFTLTLSNPVNATLGAPATATGTINNDDSTTTASQPLNDTGITGCGDYAYTDTGTSYDVTGSGTHNNKLDCSIQPVVPTQTTDGSDADGDIIRAGQDALFGRDVTNNDNSDGHAGFSFTRLDANGNALADQTQNYATNPWSCVKDNVTGLIWEVKTTSGLQTNSYTYTWYNSTGINDGGDWGIGDTGVGTTTGYETYAGTYAGSDNCANNTRCDTEKYVADVNASNSGAGLCGATNWRLPSKHELNSIVNNNAINPAIDANYFPNTKVGGYWSSSPFALNSRYAWYVSSNYGGVGSSLKGNSFYVRLVRGSQ